MTAAGFAGWLACLAWGMLLGLAYFAGLGWTVARLLRSNRPGLLWAGSLAARLLLLLAGIAVALDGSWQRAAACLAGVLLARTLLLRRWSGSTRTP